MRAKGPAPYQPGATPQDTIEGKSGLKARTIISAVAMVRAFSPDPVCLEALGQRPRLVWVAHLALHSEFIK